MDGELHQKKLTVDGENQSIPPRFWRNPRLRAFIGVTLAVAFLAGMAGLPRLEFNDQYRKTFESNSPAYAAYLDYINEFGSAENRWIVMVDSEGAALISKPLVPILRKLDFDLRTANFAESVASIFDARGRKDIDGYFPPLIPADTASPAEFSQAEKEANANPLVSNVLISADGKAALWIISQGEKDIPGVKLQTALASLNRIAEDYSGQGGLRIKITGLPAMRCELIRLLHKQNSLFYPLVALVGFVVSWLLLRNIAAVFLTIAAPLIGTLLTLGLMGWSGTPLNVINNILAPLIMVIGFSDSVHLVFRFGRLRSSGMDRTEAAWNSLKSVGPACLITSITTATALLSLQFATSTILQHFAWTAAIAVLVMFLSVVLLTPLLCASRIGGKVKIRRGAEESSDTLLWEKLGGFVTRNAGSVTALYLVGLAASLYFAAGLRPDHRYGEYLPENNSIASALDEVDARFSGSSFISLIIERQNAFNHPADSLPIISEIEQILKSEFSLGYPQSLKTLLETFPTKEEEPEDKLNHLLAELPEEALSKIIGSSGKRIRVVVPIPELGASETKGILERLDKNLDQLRTSYPDVQIHVAGLPVLAAEASSTMILELAFSLLAASVLIFAVIGLFFRSFALGVATLLPNLLPLAATAAILFLSGHPLQYTSVLVFTICLGIAVDDSIHFLVCYIRLRKRSQKLSDSQIVNAMKEVGPAISATTLILVAGLAVLILSEVPTTRLFGQLACLAILWALIADLSFLPASLSFGRKIRAQFRSST